MRGLWQMLPEVLGPKSAQISSHGGETIRVRPLQIAVQRENEIGQAHLRSPRRETVQVRLLRSSVWRTIPIEGT